MSDTLRLPLGIDFGAFDRDIAKAAEKIDQAGKKSPLVLNPVATVATGGMDPDRIAAAVGGVGMRLSASISGGLQQSAALMTGFAAHMNKMMDRTSGATIEMFRRLDASMKFPAFDSFLTRAKLGLLQFGGWSKNGITAVGTALSGGLGPMAKNLAAIFSELFAKLAATISTSLSQALATVADQFARIQGQASGTVPILDDMVQTTKKLATVSTTAATTAMPQRSQVAGVGRRIGFGTQFTAPDAPIVPNRPKANILGDYVRFAKEAAAAFSTVAGKGTMTGVILRGVFEGVVKFPLEFARSVATIGGGFLQVVQPVMRFRNFVSSIGDVGKASFRSLYEQTGILHRAFISLPMGLAKLGYSLASLPFRVFSKGVTAVTGFGGSVGGATTSVGQLQGAVRSVGSQLLMAFGVVGVLFKTVEFFKDGIKGASDLNETVSRSKVVFGDAFGPVEQQANAMSKAFGLSRQSQLDVASGFGAMAQGAGMGEEASASLANQMTKMAADLSSSVNIPFAEAGEKIRSALAGQSEPLRQFGANISDDAVKAYALSHGLARSKDAISEQAKITARAALVMQGLAYAQGDLERTSGSAANQFRKAGGGMAEFGVRIGELLLPAVQLGAEAFNTLLEAALEVFEASLPTIQTWAGYISGVMTKVGMIARNLGAVWQIAQLRVGEFVINTIAWIETIPANFGPVTEWLGRNWWNLLVDFASMTSTAFTNLLDNATRFGQALWKALKGEGWEFVWTPLLKGFEATTEAFPDLIRPALINVDDEVQRIWGDVAKKEAARADALAKAGSMAAPKKPGPLGDEKTDKTPEYKLASAVEIGSKEAYSIIAKSSAGGGRSTTDAVRENVQATREVRESIDKMAASFGTRGDWNGFAVE